jgi:hypothetical protein
MAPSTDSYARTQSSFITDNLETVCEIYSRFTEAVDRQYLPTLKAATDRSALSLTDTSDLYIYDPGSGKDIAHVFLAYLAPYAPGLTVTFVGHTPGELPAGTTWSISEDGSTLTKRSLSQPEKTYDTAKLRRNHPDINGVGFREFWQTPEHGPPAKGYAVYNTYTGSIIPATDNDNVMGRQRAEEHLIDLVNSPATDVTEDHLEIVAISDLRLTKTSENLAHVTVDVDDNSNWEAATPKVTQAYHHRDDDNNINYIVTVEASCTDDESPYTVSVIELSRANSELPLAERRKNGTVWVEQQFDTEQKANTPLKTALTHISQHDRFNKQAYIKTLDDRTADL